MNEFWRSDRGTYRVGRAWTLLLSVWFCGIIAVPWSLADGKSCVWEVQGKMATIYLGGTVHLLRDQDHPIPLVFQKAYEQSAQLYFEVEMEALTSLKFRRWMMERSLLPGGERLKERISPPLYQELLNYLAKRQVAERRVDRLNPAMMAVTISSLEAEHLGAKPELGVEAIFNRLARGDGKPVRGLETPEFQVELFDGLNEEEQEEMLRVTLEHVGDMEELLDQLIPAWRQGDTAKLDETLNRYLGTDTKLAQLILYDRNRAWVTRIEKALQESSDSLFFLVGAGHLVGDRGVVSLLQQRGWETRQPEAGEFPELEAEVK